MSDSLIYLKSIEKFLIQYQKWSLFLTLKNSGITSRASDHKLEICYSHLLLHIQHFEYTLIIFNVICNNIFLVLTIQKIIRVPLVPNTKLKILYSNFLHSYSNLSMSQSVHIQCRHTILVHLFFRDFSFPSLFSYSPRLSLSLSLPSLTLSLSLSLSL